MSEYKLVPVELLKDWHKRINTIAIETAFDVADEIGAMLTAAPTAPVVQGEPLGYVVPRMAARLGKGELCGISVLNQLEDGHTLPVYLTSQPTEQQPDVTQLVEALECALETMENVDGANDCSLGIDAVEEALAAHRKQGGE